MDKPDDPFFGNIPPDETVKLVFTFPRVRTNVVLCQRAQRGRPCCRLFGAVVGEADGRQARRAKRVV
jgi:hypothetical protein